MLFALTVQCAGLLAVQSAGAQEGLTWAAVNTAIRAAYPNVRTVTTAELAVWLADSAKAPVLLDTRAKEEYDVSHLPRAHLTSALDEALTLLAGDTDRLIVTYCSVGYRSGGFGKALGAEGFTNVFNLEGSIFLWANQDRPVFRGSERVDKVHPFDTTWGQLLDRRFWPESFE